MVCSTFRVEIRSNNTLTPLYDFVGENVYSDEELDIYHEKHNSNDDIDAFRETENKSYILKDNSKIECSKNLELDWDSQYEIQLYCLGTDDINYIISLGWINNMISIDTADRAKIHIENTPVTIVAEYVENYGWDLDMIRNNMAHDSYTNHSVNSYVSSKFSSDSELVQVGFKDYIPESVTIEHP